MYMLWLINSSPDLPTTAQMTFWLSDAALWWEIANSPPDLLLWCGKAERAGTEEELQKLLSLLEHCRVALEWLWWREGLLKSPAGKIALKGVFFVSYNISHIPLASSTWDMISPLLPGHKEYRDCFHSNSLNFNFNTEIFRLLMGFSWWDWVM